jgi:hypothetical protein
MRQKMITLCPNSFEIAQKKPNFSAWVRRKLLEEYAGSPDNRGFCYQYKCPLCKKIEIKSTRYACKCVNCNYPMKFEGELIV